MEGASHDIRVKAFNIITGLFGLVWLLNAAFQARAWLFAPSGEAAANLLHAFAKLAGDAPPWLKPVLVGVLHGVQELGPGAVAIAMVAVATLLGLALLTRRALNIFAVFGLLYSLVCWLVLNALGFPYTHGQTDPGVFVAYAIAFLFVLSIGLGDGMVTGREAPIANALWRAARVFFGLLWAFDAGLKWLPAFLFHFTSQITSVIAGQPHWIAVWLGIVASVVAAVGPVIVAVIIALTETAIALGLLFGRGLRFVLPLGILYSLAVWATPEAFGGPYTAAGTGVRGNVVGNVIIYVIPFMFLSAEYFTRRRRTDYWVDSAKAKPQAASTAGEVSGVAIGSQCHPLRQETQYR